MKKRILSCFLVVSMAFGILTGCGSGESVETGKEELSGVETTTNNGGEKKKIVFWYSHTGAEGSYYAQAAQDFNESQDQYEVEALSVTDRQKYIVAISGNEAPDVIEISNQDIITYANNGLIEDLQVVANEDSYSLDVYSKQALEANTINDSIYGIPLLSVIIQMFYNKDILEEIGYSEPPETMEELYEMAVKATQVDESGTITRLGYPLFPLASARQELIYAFGGSWWAEDGNTLTPDNPNNIESLKMNLSYREGYEISKVQEFIGTANTNRYSENDMFFAGKQLFRFDGPWLSAMIKEFESDVNYGVTMIPGTKANPENRGSSRYETASFAIPIVAKEKNGAWEFIKFATNSAETKDILLGVGSLPALLSLYEDKDILEQPNYEAFVEALKLENGIQYAKITDFAKYISLIDEHLDYVYNGMQSPEEAMKNLAEQSKLLE